jgi:wyosine [tRNA(Phe)-imidazoG37] synthetase (radical SAM superfamily)
MPVAYIFGPVPSRRLGLSLGVDLLPPKTCTYECLYCQVGRTTRRIIEPAPLVPLGDVLEDLRESLDKVTPDIITFSGSGEPTLHSGIDRVIDFVRGVTETRIAVLTNGSLFWRKEVRGRVLKADIIMPTLSTVFEETFRAIHRPHPDLHSAGIIEGLKCLREEYRGELFLEVLFVTGYNDSDREIEGLRGVIERISPDRIQLNTVVRPPADSRALSLDRRRLEEIKIFFGEKAEIIADIPPKGRERHYDSAWIAALEMAKRRPVRVQDVAASLNLPADEAEKLVKGMMLKGTLRQEEHAGEVYYVDKREEEENRS